MDVNPNKVGAVIGSLRRTKGLTQENLGERLGVTPQAVSKWERGDALPDIGVLPDLAAVLETSADNILSGGEATIEYKGKITVDDMRRGVQCLLDAGRYLGRNNMIYRYAIDGINNGMNTDFELCLSDERLVECFAAEAVIQCLKDGAYVDVTDVKNSFACPKYREIVLSYAARYGIK